MTKAFRMFIGYARRAKGLLPSTAPGLDTPAPGLDTPAVEPPGERDELAFQGRPDVLGEWGGAFAERISPQDFRRTLGLPPDIRHGLPPNTGL